MRALRSLLHHKNLLSLPTVKSLSNCGFLFSNPAEKSSSVHRSIYLVQRCVHAGNRSWEEEYTVSSSFRDPGESPRAWTSYDPFTDQLESRGDGASDQEEESTARFRADKSAKKTFSTKERYSEGVSNEREDGPGVWTFFDPLEEQLVTRAAEEDDSPEEKRSKTEKVVQKRVLKKEKKSEEDSSEGDERNRVSLGSSSQSWSSIVRRRTGKVKASWLCDNCGAKYGQWWGTCSSCQTMGSVKKFLEPELNRCRGAEVSEAAVRSGHFGMEVARVLGGGIVPGSLVLVGGDPGVGKSTLLLQIAAMVAQGLSFKGPAPVVYVSGEESIEQIGNRAYRMGITTEDLYLYSSTDIEDILDKIQKLSPQALIVDSIQTVYLSGIAGSAGNVMQVKECTSALLRFAKQTNIPVLLMMNGMVSMMIMISINKGWSLVNPSMVMNQMVYPPLSLKHFDARALSCGELCMPIKPKKRIDFEPTLFTLVAPLVGERCSSYRLLRSVKNRFGSTDESSLFQGMQISLRAKWMRNPKYKIYWGGVKSKLGVFEMSESGLQAVSNPSEMFLSEYNSDSEILAGLAVAVIVDGSRAFVVEVQALCVSGSSVTRHVNGLQENRADMIISAIFLNVVSGFKLTETAGDLAVAAAICSSFMEFPIPHDIAFIGEIGLGGELRTVPRMDKRVIAVAKLGFKKCVIPKAAEKLLSALDLDILILGCRNLKQVINVVFQAN
ncbi:DNA repair protein RadA [Cocos nucifera]|uniref:DNA repair protein RadA n=1 Tax=Cocos nucifera TaxID=13894 RepID=A0A8K0MZA6_COCNU|nr:DNA repair protein RadA [Cocos nucifera]